MHICRYFKLSMRSRTPTKSSGLLLAVAVHFCCLFHSTCAAIETNITVDDQSNGALTYTPSSEWNQGADCTFCASKLNASEAFDGTWHDGSYNPVRGDQALQIAVSFTGTAVYTFFIVPDQNALATSLNFTLDGADAGSYHHTLTNQSLFLYNMSTFSRTGLDNTAHTLIITSGGDTNSLLLFDYLVYTAENGDDSPNTASPEGDASTPPPSSPTKSNAPPTISSSHTNGNTSATETASSSIENLFSAKPSSFTKNDIIPMREIIGPVIGGAVALAIVLALLVIRRKRGARRSSSTSGASESLETTEPHVSDLSSTEDQHLDYLLTEFGFYRAAAATPELRTGQLEDQTPTSNTEPRPSELAGEANARPEFEALQMLSSRPQTLLSTTNADPPPDYVSVILSGQ